LASYVESQLLLQERIVYEARLHWIIFVPAALITLIGLVFPPVLLVAFVFLLIATITYTSTELVITDRRVLAKFGFIRRITFEQNLSRIEGANLEQSIPGRIFGYGTIAIRGVGQGRTPIPQIADPLEFNRMLAMAMDAAMPPSERTARP